MYDVIILVFGSGWSQAQTDLAAESSFLRVVVPL